MKSEVESQDALDNPLSPASSIDSSSVDDFDKLIDQQTRKTELLKRRDLLLRKKQQLRNDCENFRSLLSTYKEEKVRQETRKKLEFFLHQNDHEYLKLSTPDEAANFVLDNLGILPSNDWDMRQKFTYRLYPHLEVNDCSTTYNYTKSEPKTQILFTLMAAGLPPMKIEVDVVEEEISSLKICNFEDISATLQTVSDSYRKCVACDYIPHCKLDMLVFSYQLLSQIQCKRVSAFKTMIIEFKRYLFYPQPSAIEEKSLDIILLCLPYIQLSIEKGAKTFFVRLQWDILLVRHELGEFESLINFSILNHDFEHMSFSNDVFQRLLSTYGVVEAFRLMILNLFTNEVANM